MSIPTHDDAGNPVPTPQEWFGRSESVGANTDEQAIIRRAYMELLRLPHRALRARLQSTLATLVHEIANGAGRDPEEVQDAYEAFIAAERQ